ncbi:MAG: RNA polymerase sigma factor [Acidimicrobiales bacterium]
MPSEGSELRVSSFPQFFDEQHDRLLAHAYALTGDIELSEDIVQEVMIRAWKRWHYVSRLDLPGSWARKVLRNLAVDNWRNKSVRRRHESIYEPVPPPDVGHLDVANALRRLPELQRTSLILHDVVGLSVAEVASEMSVPEGSVRAWLFRGRQRLAELLEFDSPKTFRKERT